METTLTFHVSNNDKKRILEEAKKLRLSLSSYCRVVLLNNLSDVQKEELETKKSQEEYFGY